MVGTCNVNVTYSVLPIILFCFFIIEVSRYLRLDKGTETGDMATIHAYVKQSLECVNDDEAVKSVQYGPSTSNKVRKLFC